MLHIKPIKAEALTLDGFKVAEGGWIEVIVFDESGNSYSSSINSYEQLQAIMIDLHEASLEVWK